MKYALKNAVILDGTKDMEPLRGQSVLVEGETIVGLVPAGSEPMGFEPVDLSGKYLMPGLFNISNAILFHRKFFYILPHIFICHLTFPFSVLQSYPP